jgi:FkbM family methyltransferase
MKNYSQNSEQQIILDFFQSKSGAVLDIGCNDGVTFSNSRAVLELGWRGVLVDASPGACQKAKDNSKGLDATVIHAALGPACGRITLHESGTLLNKGDKSLVSTIKPDEKGRWPEMKWQEVEVPMIDFPTLMLLSPVKTFDLVSIDIEGGERDLLPQINFDALQTKMAIIEWNGKDRDFYDAIMHGYGFSTTHKNAENLIFTR